MRRWTQQRDVVRRLYFVPAGRAEEKYIKEKVSELDLEIAERRKNSRG